MEADTDFPAWLFGAAAALAVTVTWFAPKMFAAGRGGIRTLRQLLDLERRRAAARRLAATSEEKVCAFCGTTAGVSESFLVPLSIHVNDGCAKCQTLRSSDNRLLACTACAARRDGKGFYEFFALQHPRDEHFSDHIPPVVERRYLDAVEKCLGCARALDAATSKQSVLAIDSALRPYV